MNYEEIEATIGELRRYATSSLRIPDKHGDYVRSTFIPRCSRAEGRKAEKLASARTYRVQRSEWVPVKFLITDQDCLYIKSLRYAARTYIRHQVRGDKLPTLVHTGRGRYYVRDGNHRSTIAVMIGGDLKIRALVVRPIRKRNRKKSLTRRSKHG